MQKIRDWCVRSFEGFFNSRTVVLMLTFFMLAFCGNVHTRWAKSLFYFFIMPVQIGMSYMYIRDKAIRMDGVFRLVCISLLWCLISTMINSAWSVSGMVSHWTLFGCWIFALFMPKNSTLQDIHEQIFKVGMVFIVCFLPFILIAISTVFTGKVIYVPWDHTPLGIQNAGQFGSRMRIMMNPNKIGIILVYNIFFAIYGFITRPKKAWRAFFVFVIIANVIASAHVMSRTSVMGLAAAMGMFGFRFVYQKLAKMKIVRIIVGVAVCALVFLLVVNGMDWIYHADVSIAEAIHDYQGEWGEFQSKNDSFGTFDATSSGRGEIWEGSMLLLKEKPMGLVIGYGSENVIQMMVDSPNIPKAETDWFHVHSAYLDSVMRGGIPYLLMVFAFLLCLVKPAWQIGMEKSTPETKGLFIIPMFIVALLVMSCTEVMLFVDSGYTNFLFMMMCGYLLHYKALRREGKIGA